MSLASTSVEFKNTFVFLQVPRRKRQSFPFIMNLEMSGCQGTFTGMQRNQMFRGKDSCHSNGMYSPNMLLRKIANSGSWYSNRRSQICTHSVTLLSENLLRTIFWVQHSTTNNSIHLSPAFALFVFKITKVLNLEDKIFIVFKRLSLFLIGT